MPRSWVSERQPPTDSTTRGVPNVAIAMPTPMPACASPLASPSSASPNHSPSALGKFDSTSASDRPNPTIETSIRAECPACARSRSEAAASSAPPPSALRTPSRSPIAPAGTEKAMMPSAIPAQSVPHSRLPRRSAMTPGTTMIT